jgi:2-polyprenyl-6-methoxyphenol hydroxylase-like FAD-dependent oxidoreductase
MTLDNSKPDDLLYHLQKGQLDEVVEAVKRALSVPSLRTLSQRAVQAKIWHEQPVVSGFLQDLRAAEENIRSLILAHTSQLVYIFHEHAIDATLDRAGILNGATSHVFELFCLDAKERLYMVLKEYDWLQDFFRRYPLHFYENSFQFVHRIPVKTLPVKVKVIGLGIGGSMVASGLAKRGIAVNGFEKRCEHGPGSVTSRYQNASWRAYDTAASMVDEKAYELLVENRQRIHVKQQDGSTTVVESDRVQIILGSAIQAALDSARGYGAVLHFECKPDDYYPEDDEACDIVALFCGAHTASAFPGVLKEEIMSWPELDSTCKMWLRVQQSDKMDTYCTRGGEIGTEQWHYTIESARSDIRDIERVRWNQESQYQYSLKKLKDSANIGMNEVQLSQQYETQRSQLDKVLQAVKEQQQLDNTAVGSRFDYIFTNAPANAHNLAKREQVSDTVVLDGGYTVEVKMTTNSTASSGELLERLKTKLVVLGGDASVPPNPLAAYGATLACEAAASLVLLAVGIGHLNAILQDMESMKDFAGEDWVQQVEKLKDLLAVHYEARALSENYFQFVQTLICNLYSLPAFY